jgi:raffinose/stachyose/melibiose transport system substrate-binding protein
MLGRTRLVTLLIFMLTMVLSLSLVQAQDQVTLRLWDTHQSEGATQVMDEMVAAFEAANPNIHIERDVQTVDDMRPVLRTALVSGTGPDIFYYDTGPGFAGVLADAGLLMPLTEAYETRGWDHIFEWTKARTTFGGEVYGISNALEFLGAYYNMDLFAELGLEAPTTYEEFLAVSQALKDAGYIPVAFGNQAGWPAYHLFSIYLNNVAGKEKMDDLLFNGASWNDPDVIEAIRLFFVDMNEQGYLIPTPNAISYDDANAVFFNGQAGMLITGTWLIGDVVSNATFDAGWFFVPNPQGGDPLPPGGVGSAYFISAQTEHPEETLLFLDFLFDPANAHYWMEGMNIIPPYPVDTTDLEIPELLQFAVDTLATSTLGYNVDVLTPANFNTAMADDFQAVLLGQKTPEEVAVDLESAMEAYRAEQAQATEEPAS